MMEALSSSETSVLRRAARRNVPEDGILYFFNRLQAFLISWPFLYFTHFIILFLDSYISPCPDSLTLVLELYSPLFS
jgi:hypothetical protein